MSRKKLEMVYGIIRSLDVLIQNFYWLVQEKSEKVQVFTTQLEEALSQIYV